MRASLILLLLVFGGSVLGADEQLAMPQFPAGWTQAFTREGPDAVTEYVPTGQTHETFQDKISIESYGKLDLPLDALQRRAVAQAHDGCDGVMEGKFQSGLNNGYPSAFWTVGCKRLKRTSFGETRYTKAIQSGATLYVITRLWRTKNYGDRGPAIPQKSLDEAMSFLTSVVVCRTGSADHPCPAPRAR